MIVQEIKDVIMGELLGSTAYVANPRKDGKHFEAIVVSPTFVGQSLVKQHQAVMLALKQKFESNVHAFSLKTFTPEKWEEESPNFEKYLKANQLI